VKFWEKLSTWQKRATTLSALMAALVAIGGLTWSGAELLATDKEVAAEVAKVNDRLDEHMDQQVLSEKRSAIQSAKAQIRQIDFQLLDEDLPFNKREFLNQSKQELKDLIACIQEGKTLCE
jgi:hypothetical protein